MIRGMMSRHITIYHAISHTYPGTPHHFEFTTQIEIQRKPTASWRSIVFFAFVSPLILACLPSGLFCRPESFCCPSAVHIMGLTVPPAKSNLVPSGLGLLPERMYVCFVSFFFFLCFVFFLSLSFFLLDAWYLVLLRL